MKVKECEMRTNRVSRTKKALAYEQNNIECFYFKYSKSINNEASGLPWYSVAIHSICRMLEGEWIESVQSFDIEIKS